MEVIYCCSYTLNPVEIWTALFFEIIKNGCCLFGRREGGSGR